MDAVLLDTDVFSYLMRPKDTRGDAYRPHVKGKTVAVSFVTVGELFYGAEKRKWSAKTLSHLQEKLKAVVIVPMTRNFAVRTGAFGRPCLRAS
jgi:predicted nucleic acid-binding protein